VLGDATGRRRGDAVARVRQRLERLAGAGEEVRDVRRAHRARERRPEAESFEGRRIDAELPRADTADGRVIAGACRDLERQALEHGQPYLRETLGGIRLA